MLRRHGLLFAALIGTLARDGTACVSGQNVLMVDSTPAGAVPGPVAAVTYAVKRGQGPRSLGGGEYSASDCDYSGTVSLHFTASKDPDNGNTELGYRITLIRGTAPPELELGHGPVLAYFEASNDVDGALWVFWNDGATDDQEPIDFTLTLTPVDVHGNEGPTSDPIRVQDPGSSSSSSTGCAVRRRHTARSEVVLVAMTLLSLAIRKRRRGEVRATRSP